MAYGVVNVGYSPLASDVFYCTCDTADGEYEKVVTPKRKNFALREGVVIEVTFTNRCGSVAEAVCLNVAGTGEIMADFAGSVFEVSRGGGYWSDGAVLRFRYDGSVWKAQNWQAAGVGVYGFASLSSRTDWPSEAAAATPKAVNTVYKLADGKADCESGIWTPKFTADGADKGGLDAGSAEGYYLLLGCKCTVWGSITCLGGTGGAATSFGVKGLPFACKTHGCGTFYFTGTKKDIGIDYYDGIFHTAEIISTFVDIPKGVALYPAVQAKNGAMYYWNYSTLPDNNLPGFFANGSKLTFYAEYDVEA